MLTINCEFANVGEGVRMRQIQDLILEYIKGVYSKPKVIFPRVDWKIEDQFIMVEDYTLDEVILVNLDDWEYLTKERTTSSSEFIRLSADEISFLNKIIIRTCSYWQICWMSIVAVEFCIE